MKILLAACCVVGSYLCGGVNTAILLSRALYQEDIREKGSGNPGFTNFKRVYGMRYAWLVFAGDLLKTVLPVLTFSLLFSHVFGARQLGAALSGLFAMVGHSYPVWYRFRGGKCFSCMAASVWFIDWRAGLLFAAVFLLLLFTVRIMSVSSMSAAAVPPLFLAVCGAEHPLVLLCTTLSAALLLWRHRSNLTRLLCGEEPRFHLSGGKAVRRESGAGT